MTQKTNSKIQKTRAGHVAIVGRPNVGKSTLLNALLGETIAITSRYPQTTRDRILGVLTEKNTQFIFVDTPGVHRAKTRLGSRMNQEARDAARGADVILFVTDIDSKVLGARLRPADMAILKELPPSPPVILVLNKIDRITDKTALIGVLEGHAKDFAFAAIIPITARRKADVAHVLAELRERLPIGEMPFDGETLTDRPIRFLVAELVREQILHHTREEVPHGVAVLVERFDDDGASATRRGQPQKARVPKIELAVHVDREGHKKIIIGKGGSLLKEIGTAARVRVEALMGQKVHLQIWVRVTPGWYESESGLRDMGYGGDKNS